jgi:hypothetical protein
MRSDARECILDMLGEKHLIKGISDSLTRGVGERDVKKSKRRADDRREEEQNVSKQHQQ